MNHDGSFVFFAVWWVTMPTVMATNRTCVQYRAVKNATRTSTESSTMHAMAIVDTTKDESRQILSRKPSTLQTHLSM